MTKKAITSTDPLIRKVRRALKTKEPRPEPTETRKNAYGHDQVKCPDCGEWCYKKRGSYNHHWTLRHGTPFWKEKNLIRIITQEVTK